MQFLLIMFFIFLWIHHYNNFTRHSVRSNCSDKRSTRRHFTICCTWHLPPALSTAPPENSQIPSSLWVIAQPWGCGLHSLRRLTRDDAGTRRCPSFSCCVAGSFNLMVIIMEAAADAAALVSPSLMSREDQRKCWHKHSSSSSSAVCVCPVAHTRLSRLLLLPPTTHHPPSPTSPLQSPEVMSPMLQAGSLTWWWKGKLLHVGCCCFCTTATFFCIPKVLSDYDAVKLVDMKHNPRSSSQADL